MKRIWLGLAVLLLAPLMCRAQYAPASIFYNTADGSFHGVTNGVDSKLATSSGSAFVYVGAFSGIPATCSVGQVSFITDATAGQNLYFCTATNTWTQQTGAAQVYPGAGVANSTGSAWGTSYTVGVAANNLVQLNGSSQLPALSAALLTSYPISSLAAGTGGLTTTPGGSVIFQTTSAVSEFFGLENTTAATSGTSQSSPVDSLCGTEWHGAASVKGCLTIQFQPGNGTDAASTINLGHTGSATGVVTSAFPGPIQAGASSNAGAIFLPGNTSNPAVPSNSFGIIGPPSASFTSYALSIPSTPPSGTQYLGCGTPSSNVSACTWATVGGTPAGSNTQVQFNSSSAFGASANLTWVSPTLTIGVAGTQTGSLALTSSTATGSVTLTPASAASAFTVTIPAATDTLVNLAGTQTLTNKSLVLTEINSGLTSGGVVCATSTTVISMTAALTVNVMPKGGGAGVCPTNSLLTDTGTSATYTGTGGILAPIFTANGTTAGFIDFPQGSTSAAVAPCNVATSRCVQAPTAMTASVETLDGGESQGARFTTGSTSAFQDMNSGDANHSATVTTGSGTSIGSTSLCSTANCPAGTYRLNAYIDITTACGTSGTYTVSVVYTDDQGSKTFVLPLTGTGSVPATGVLTTTSTSNWGEASIVLRSTGAASINYLTTATACGSAGPMVGKLYLSVEAVQ